MVKDRVVYLSVRSDYNITVKYHLTFITDSSGNSVY